MLQAMYEVLLKLTDKCHRWLATMHMHLRSQDVYQLQFVLSLSVSIAIKCGTFDAAWLEGISMTCLFV